MNPGILLGIALTLIAGVLSPTAGFDAPVPAAAETGSETQASGGTGEETPAPEETGEAAPSEAEDQSDVPAGVETEAERETAEEEAEEEPEFTSPELPDAAVTGGGDDASGPPRATRSTPAVCVPSQIYGITFGASVYSVAETGGPATRLGGWYDLHSAWNLYNEGLNQGRNVPTKYGANGLAVASDGTMYAYGTYYQYDSLYPDTYWNVAIKMMVKEPGDDTPWRWLDETSYLPQTYPYSYNTNQLPVAGAIDPLTGNYVWGGFKSGYFHIHEIDLDTGDVSISGRVYVGNGSPTSLNGDIAFDGAGNLYVLSHHPTNGTLTITTVSAADLAAGRIQNAGVSGYTAIPSVIPGSIAQANQTAQYGGQVNGIAVGGDGGLYIGTMTNVYRINPTTAQIIGSAITSNPYTTPSSDLSSCAGNAPTTLTVQKDLPDEEATGAFTLSISSGGNVISSVVAETKPAGSTVLEEKIGPAMVATGDTYELAETSARLGDYSATLTCRIDGVSGPAGEVSVGGDGTTSGSVTIPSEAAGQNVTCTFTNTLEPVEPAVCLANTLYSVDWHTSMIKQITLGANGTTSSGVTTTDLGRLSPTNVTSGYNALAMTADGSTLWASDQGNGKAIYQVDVATGNVITYPNAWNFQTPGYGAYAPGYLSGSGLIGGSINPHDGLYYAYNSLTGYLYAFHTSGPDIGKPVGLVGAVNRTANGLDGGNVSDIAFDLAGNLFFTANTTAGNQSLYRIRGPIDTASGVVQMTPEFVSGTLLANSNAVGSLAFGSNGNLYLGTSNVAPQISELNPASGAPISTTGSAFPISGSPADFASCSSPSTLTIEKNIVERVDPGDQFSFGVSGGDLQAAVQAETTGTETGLQEPVAGPVVVTPGSEYTIAETAAAGSLDGYTSTYVCRDQDGAEVMSGTGPSFAYVPSEGSDQSGAAVTCTFTNAPKDLGSVVWEKVQQLGDGSIPDHAHLGGSEWKLIGPAGPNSDSVLVDDCVEATPADCSADLDQDPRKGYFSLTGLAWGEYQLFETRAPAGFQLDSAPIQFTIGEPDGSGDIDLHWDLGMIENRMMAVPGLPMTGGLGEQMFWLGAGGFMIAALVGAAAHGIRRKHAVS